MEEKTWIFGDFKDTVTCSPLRPHKLLINNCVVCWKTNSLWRRLWNLDCSLTDKYIVQRLCESRFILIWDLARDLEGNLAFVSHVKSNIITRWHHFKKKMNEKIQGKTLLEIMCHFNTPLFDKNVISRLISWLFITGIIEVFLKTSVWTFRPAITDWPRRRFSFGFLDKANARLSTQFKINLLESLTLLAKLMHVTCVWILCSLHNLSLISPPHWQHKRNCYELGQRSSGSLNKGVGCWNCLPSSATNSQRAGRESDEWQHKSTMAQKWPRTR